MNEIIINIDLLDTHFISIIIMTHLHSWIS